MSNEPASSSETMKAFRKSGASEPPSDSAAGEPSGSPDEARLEVYAKSGKLITTIPLPDGTYIIGRSDDCDIQCEGANNVSRRHAELTIRGVNAHIRDLNSTVGTMVNSKILSESELNTGDVIQLGMMKFHLHLPSLSHLTGSVRTVKVKEDVDDDKMENFENELSVLSSKCAEIRREVGKVIVGQGNIVEGILAALLCQGHCLLVGVPGLAKTVMVVTFAKVLGLDTKRIQFTPDLMPSDIVGSERLKQSSSGGVPELQFVQGPIFTQLLLADEINRTPPKTQAALLEAMQERQVTVAMKSFQLPLPFCVVATQNPIEQEGTYPLPEAQQDRFMFCLHLDYPDFKDELEVMKRTTAKTSGESCRCCVTENDIIRFHRTVQMIGVPDEQMEFAVRIVRATRPGSDESKKAGVSDLIDWGAGPRAGQAILRGAKVIAAMDGRPAIASDDILHLLLPVLRHRISCNYRARAEGMREDDVIRKIMDRISSR